MSYREFHRPWITPIDGQPVPQSSRRGASADGKRISPDSLSNESGSSSGIDCPEMLAHTVSESIAQLYPFVDQNDTPIPTHWSLSDRHPTIYLLADKLHLRYKGKGSSQTDAASIRSSHPIPRSCGIFYFELTIEKLKNLSDIPPEQRGGECMIGIGIMDKRIPLNRLPGWDQNSFGYHGDDGNFFSASGKGSPYGPKFGAGDVVGCGINFVKRKIFFTKNGTHLEYVSDITFCLDYEYYPVVGMQSCGQIVSTNFGQKPFKFDISREMAQCRHLVKQSFLSLTLPPEKAIWMNETVASWLCHVGYPLSAENFAKTNGLALPVNPELICQRHKFVKAIKEGDVKRVLPELEQTYKEVLQRTPELWILLKVQVLVESNISMNEELHKASAGRERDFSRSRDRVRTRSQRRKEEHPVPSSSTAPATPRSGTKRRNSEHHSNSSGSPRRSLRGSRSSLNSVDSGASKSMNGRDSAMEVSNGNSQHNGCSLNNTTTTIIVERQDSVSEANGDADMEDLSGEVPVPHLMPLRHRELFSAATVEQYKGYTDIMCEAQAVMQMLKEQGPLSPKLHDIAMQAIELMTCPPHLLHVHYGELVSQEHRNLVAALLNRAVLECEGFPMAKTPVCNLLDLLDVMRPNLSQYSLGGIGFIDVDKLIFEGVGGEEEEEPEGMHDHNLPYNYDDDDHDDMDGDDDDLDDDAYSYEFETIDDTDSGALVDA